MPDLRPRGSHRGCRGENDHERTAREDDVNGAAGNWMGQVPTQRETGVRQWHVQLTLKDGTRSKWIPLDPSIPETDRPSAQACATRVSDDARANGFVSDTVVETVSEYAKRWIKARTGRVASVRDNASHLKHHILPVLGPLDMRAVERKDIEKLVAALDVKVRAKGGIGNEVRCERLGHVLEAL